jgi:hypothetical protein
MTATTSKLGADMLTDEQRQAVENAVYGRTLTQANVFALADLLSVRQPAAIDKQCTCKGVLGHSRQCAMFDESMMSIAAPLANEASKPAVQTLSDGAQFFACYLIDNCENEVVREESVQAWLGKMLASPRYHPAAPSPAQDERGAFEAWWVRDIPAEYREMSINMLRKDMYAVGISYLKGAWHGWQARAALQAAPAADSVTLTQQAFDAMRVALEVIAVGDSLTPTATASHGLVASGFWTDALESKAADAPGMAEPVAWQVHPYEYGIGSKGVYARTDRLDQVEAWERKGWHVTALYANPQGSLTRSDLQKKAIDRGFVYWRAPDAHGVTGTEAQAVDLLQDLLGVEVEIEAQTERALTDAELTALIRKVEDKLGIVWFVPDDSETYAWRTTNTDERDKFARAFAQAIKEAK